VAEVVAESATGNGIGAEDSWLRMDCVVARDPVIDWLMGPVF